MNFPKMTEIISSEKSLENESVRKQVIPYIQEISLPTVDAHSNGEGSDIEIIEENITKKTLKKKRKNKMMNDLHKIKILNKPPEDDLAEVCGLQVSIKSLLKNDEIRRQIAPFIEEVVIECSDSEENSTSANTVPKVNDKLTDAQVLDKAKDVFAKSLTKIKNKSKSIKQKLIRNNLTVNNKVVSINKSRTADKIHVLDLTNDKSDDDVKLIKREINKTSEKNSKTNTKRIASVSESNQNNSIILENNCESPIINGNVEKIFVIDGLQQDQENIEIKDDDIPDLPITESDDWYYLNIASAPKNSSIEDDVLIIQNSLKSNENNKNIIDEKILSTPANKVETEKPVKVGVKHRKRRRQGRKLSGAHKAKKNIKQVKVKNSNIKNTNNKQTNSLNVDGGNQVGNSRNENSLVIEFLTYNEVGDRTAFENEIIENNTNSNKRLTISHELIPIIKKETESMDNLCSPMSPCADDTTNKTELNNGVFKPMLKPYKIKEITPDFYRDEEKVYKTYQKVSACGKTKSGNIQNRSANSRTAGYKDKRLLKKRCSKCGKKYERHGNLKRHEKICKTDATSETNFECPQCWYKTTWRYQYQAHVATHLVDQNLMTNYESKMFIRCTVCPLKRDISQRGTICPKCHSYLEYVCRMCGRDHTSYSNLKFHVLRSIQLVHGRTCHKCGRGGYPSLCCLKKHVRQCGMEEDENESKVVCKKIPYVRLVRHTEESKESHHVTVHCSLCDMYSETSDREAKCEMCFENVSYKCELCNEFLPSYLNLQEHVLHVHIMGTEVSLENKNEESPDLEGKIDCDEINYNIDNIDNNVQNDNIKQPLDKEDGDSINDNKPHEEKLESNQMKKEVEELDNLQNGFTEKIEDENKIFEQFKTNNEGVTDESNDTINKVSDSQCSEGASISINDAALSDIINCNVRNDKTCDSRLNENCFKNRKTDQKTPLKKKNKTSGIKRYCLRCDKLKKDLDFIRIGSKKEICDKCRFALMYQCVKCKRKTNNYSVMLHHWKRCCALLRQKDSSAAKLTPEKYKTSNECNGIQRHQCRLCPYSSNLKNRLMLHLQMHSWKDIKSAVLKPEIPSGTPVNSK